MGEEHWGSAKALWQKRAQHGWRRRHEGLNKRDEVREEAGPRVSGLIGHFTDPGLYAE